MGLGLGFVSICGAAIMGLGLGFISICGDAIIGLGLGFISICGAAISSQFLLEYAKGGKYDLWS